MAEDWLDLADVIAQLRGQIAEAQRRRMQNGDQGVQFAVGDVTVQLGMEVIRTRGADGGLKFGVVSLGAKREGGGKATHTITVQLKPQRAGGGDVPVSGWE
ncbi:trypco2 family protein [Streptomyces sp. NPDC005727]|uniref:trypco2 family protein n=1 Tax=Streptomyces sp. NPDC005727 TaxID=3157053 RepID=UPI00340CFD7A